EDAPRHLPIASRQGGVESSPHLDDGVDLDGEAEGEAVDADGGAGVAALVAEDLDHQVRAAVDDGGDGLEVAGGLDEAAQLDHADDALEVAVEGGRHLGQQVDAAHARRGLGLFRGDVGADRALDPARGVVGQLAGDVDQVPAAHEGHVVGHRRGGGGQLDAEFGEAGGDG